MSLYVRVFTNFYTHRKTMRLRGMIGDDAFWVPTRLWAYAAENQPDGDFSGYTDGEIAGLIGYHKDPAKMLEALLQAGFIDSDRKIHDWAEHNAYHQVFAQRASKAAKVKWEKERTKEKEMKGEEMKGKETSSATSIDKHCFKQPQAMLQASDEGPYSDFDPSDLDTQSVEPQVDAATTNGHRFTPPAVGEVKFHATKIGLPESEALRFWNYYGSIGWKVGKNPMKDWHKAIAGWKVRWESERGSAYVATRPRNEPNI